MTEPQLSPALTTELSDLWAAIKQIQLEQNVPKFWIRDAQDVSVVGAPDGAYLRYNKYPYLHVSEQLPGGVWSCEPFPLQDLGFVSAMNDWGLSQYAGGFPQYYSRADHRHSTMLPRLPQTGTKYVGFNENIFGGNEVGLILASAKSGGDYIQGVFDAEDTPSGISLESLCRSASGWACPVAVNGYGRPIIQLESKNNGSCNVRIFNDLDTAGAYGSTSALSQILSFLLDSGNLDSGHYTSAGLRLAQNGASGTRAGLSIFSALTGGGGAAVILTVYNNVADELRVRNSAGTGDATVRALAFPATSTDESKRDIKPLTSPTRERIAALRPVSFKRPASLDTEGNPLTGKLKEHHEAVRLGFRVTEVAEVLPEAVWRDADGTPDGIDYSVIVAALVKTVQEQQAQIDGLSAKIDRLEKRGS